MRKVLILGSKNEILLFLTIQTILFLAIARYVAYSISITQTWRIGDWLISYQPGINRRFAIGEILFHVAGHFGFNLEFLVIFLQVSILVSIGILFFRTLILHITSTHLRYLLATSPLLFSMQFTSAPGNFRKEIIGYLILLILIHSNRYSKVSLLSAVLLMFIFVFSWEAAIVFWPLYLYLILKESPFNTLHKYLLAMVVALCGTSALLLAQRPIYAESLLKLCDRIVSRGLSRQYCEEGAIPSLLWRPNEIIASLQDTFWSQGKWYYVAISLLVVAIAFSAISTFHKFIYLGIVAPAFGLFALGLDYDRWVAIISIITFGFLVDYSKTHMLKKVIFFGVVGNQKRLFSAGFLVSTFFIGLPHVGFESIYETLTWSMFFTAFKTAQEIINFIF